MESAAPPARDPPATPLRDRALGIIATATLLALLYFARDVLVPITLAFILQSVDRTAGTRFAAPQVGANAVRTGGGAGVGAGIRAIAAVIGSQIVRMADSLPTYKRTLEDKLETLNDITVRRMNALTAQADKALNRNTEEASPPSTLQSDSAGSKRPISRGVARSTRESVAGDPKGFGIGMGADRNRRHCAGGAGVCSARTRGTA